MTLKHPDGSDPDSRPVRRTSTAEFKARILAEYESAPDSVARGAILRRERLYGSHILDWRKAHDAGAEAGLTDRRQSAALPAKVENAGHRPRIRSVPSRNWSLTRRIRCGRGTSRSRVARSRVSGSSCTR